MPCDETFFAFFGDNVTFVVLRDFNFNGDVFSAALMSVLTVLGAQAGLDPVLAYQLSFVVSEYLIAFPVEEDYSGMSVQNDEEDFSNVQVFLCPISFLRASSAFLRSVISFSMATLPMYLELTSSICSILIWNWRMPLLVVTCFSKGRHRFLL